MDIAMYLVPGRGDLRVQARDFSRVVAEISNGGLKVEESPERALPRQQGYGCVGDYDPVLRAHCRLDQQG
jgi:hypothetical protein